MRTARVLRAGLIGMVSLLLVNCGNGQQFSSTKDLNPGPDSSIAEPEGNLVLGLKDIDTLKVLPNTKVPKGLLVSLIGSSKSNGNYQFVKDLYNIISNINQENKLVKTIGMASVTDEMRYNQEITLVVITDRRSKALYSQLVTDLGGSSASVIPYLDKIDTNASMGDLWIQDFGEIAITKIKKSGDWAYTILDTYRNTSRGVFDPKILSDLFKVPFINLGNKTDNASQYGGNIESTAEGHLYMGDSVDSADYSADYRKSPLFSQLKDLGNPEAVKTHTDWLAVGHTDEFMSIIPAQNACGSAIIAGDALIAFDLLLNKTSDADFQIFSDELKEVPIAFNTLGYVTKTLGVELTKKQLISALAYFKIDGSSDVSLNLSDYDLSRAKPFWNSVVGYYPVSWNDFSALINDPNEYAKFYVWRNLSVMSKITSSAAEVETITCATTNYIPQLFIQNYYYDSPSKKVYYGKDSAHLPGLTNLIALRDAVIFPDTWLPAFRDYARDVTLKLVGDETDHQKVYFLDDTLYHFSLGEVHCATNPVREMNLDYKF